MRRIEKEISNREDLIGILKSGKYTIISLCKENEPYIITLSYGYDESKHVLYFHCAKEGQKIDFIKANPHICGTVIEDNGYEDGCGQAFRSINHLEKDPNPSKNKFLKKENTYENLGMLRLDIIDISGKEEKAD